MGMLKHNWDLYASQLRDVYSQATNFQGEFNLNSELAQSRSPEGGAYRVEVYNTFRDVLGTVENRPTTIEEIQQARVYNDIENFETFIAGIHPSWMGWS